VYKFTEEQKEILKKAYNRKRFTKKLYNRVLNEDVTILERKLNKIGYMISIRLKGDK
jgi:hypothetical protein